MSQENVERLRSAFDDFFAGKSNFGTDLLDPNVEWDASELARLVPDFSGVYRGIEGVRRFWQEWLAGWRTVQAEYELIDAGNSVVALLDQRMRGRSTGIEVPFGQYAQVYTFRNGLVIHWKAYLRQSDAIEAVRLAE
jgi:ketosteroid isomerase-like protein